MQPLHPRRLLLLNLLTPMQPPRRRLLPHQPPDLAAAPALAVPTVPFALALATAKVAATVDQIRALRQTQQTDRKVHNTALKWFRDTHEDPPGQPTVSRVPITYDDPIDIWVLDRDKGMAYTFVENQTQQGSWRSMIASFSDDVLEQVVGDGGVDDHLRVVGGVLRPCASSRVSHGAGPRLNWSSSHLGLRGDAAQRHAGALPPTPEYQQGEGGPLRWRSCAPRAACDWIGLKHGPRHIHELQRGVLPR